MFLMLASLTGGTCLPRCAFHPASVWDAPLRLLGPPGRVPPEARRLGLLRANGFEIPDLLELRPSEDATTDYTFLTMKWAREWPSEEALLAR
jgi:hypothetical protein